MTTIVHLTEPQLEALTFFRRNRDATAFFCCDNPLLDTGWNIQFHELIKLGFIQPTPESPMLCQLTPAGRELLASLP